MATHPERSSGRRRIRDVLFGHAFAAYSSAPAATVFMRLHAASGSPFEPAAPAFNDPSNGLDAALESSARWRREHDGFHLKPSVGGGLDAIFGIMSQRGIAIATKAHFQLTDTAQGSMAVGRIQPEGMTGAFGPLMAIILAGYAAGLLAGLVEVLVTDGFALLAFVGFFGAIPALASVIALGRLSRCYEALRSQLVSAFEAPILDGPVGQGPS